MLLSAVSVLVVAQSSSEIPEGLMNNPVYMYVCVYIYIYIYMCVCLCVCVCITYIHLINYTVQFPQIQLTPDDGPEQGPKHVVTLK